MNLGIGFTSLNEVSFVKILYTLFEREMGLKFTKQIKENFGMRKIRVALNCLRIFLFFLDSSMANQRSLPTKCQHF